MCDCFHLAFPNWHAASSGIGARRRLEGPESTPEDDSVCGEPTQFAEGERPRPQGSSPVEEDPEAARYDGDKKCESERDSGLKSGSGPKAKKSGFVSMFEKRSSTPKMRKLKQDPHSLEAGVIVETPRDGCSEGLIYGGGGKDGIFIKKVMPESPASKSLKVKEGDQILSATVYFDNMPFEDAVQILEHAQAYKVQLCLKRKPETTETDPILGSDNIPEAFCSAEMKEQGKSRSREDARISWPKISTFGKERKSCFTRSHSTSEADEQRNPELSPTTSDTESPIKSQDALKGKKKHRITLSALTKRSHTSLSEDAQTGRVSGQTQETDLTSPDDLEGALGVEANMTEVVKVENNLKPQTKADTQGIQHQLMDAGSPSKAGETALTLAGQESRSIKSPNGKKKKKEKSELKIKSPGKGKSHKKDSEVKLSPRRLKTLGASFDTEDQLDNKKLDFISNSESNKLLEDQPEPDEKKQTVGGESSKVTSSRSMTAQISLPKVELDLSDVAFVRKSPHKDKKKGQKQKQEPKPSQTSKQQRKDSSEEIQNINESTAQTGNVSSTQLPKREDMEIPGMEDMSVKAQAKRNKKQKGGFIVKTQDNQSEAVQLFIDVNSIKEAVSKLPGFKLPQVDTSGAPIPEEKTVIDANAQRIFMKTPTKVVEPGRHRDKHEAHFTTTEVRSITTKITSAGSTSADPLPEVSTLQEQETVQSKDAGGVKPEKDSAALKKSHKKIKTANITMPSFELSPEIRIPETRKDKEQAGGVMCDVQIPELEGIEFIDSVDESAAKKEGGVTSCGISASMEGSVLQITSVESEDQTARLSKPRDISGDQKTSEIKTVEQEGRASKFKLPHLSISVPKIKGPKPDFTTLKQDVEVTESQSKAEHQVTEGPESEAFILKEIKEAEKPELEMKLPETREELGKQVSKVKVREFEMEMPTFKDPELDLNLLKKNREVKTPDIKAEVHGPGEYQAEAEKTHLKIQTVEAQEKQQGSRFKIPKFGIKIPKIKSHESDLREAEVHLSETSETDVSPGKVDMDVPKQKQEPVYDDGETQGTKFTFPKFAIAMPKIKGPEFHKEISKKDPDVPLPETKAEVQIPQVTRPDISTNISMSQEVTGTDGSEQETKPLQMEGEPDEEGSRFKIPKFGIKIPKLKGPDFDVSFSTKDADVIHPEATAETTIRVSVPEEMVKAEKPQLETEPVQMEGECDGQGPKFRTPKLGIAIPSLKGPKLDVSFSKPEDGVRLSDTKVDIERVSPGLGFKALETKCPLDGKEENIKLTKSGIEIPKTRESEFHLGSPKTEVDISVLEPKVKPKASLTKAPAPGADVSDDTDRSSSTFKKTNISFSAPKFKCPDLDLGLARKQTETEAELKVLNLPNIDVSLGNAEMLIPEGKVEAGEPAVQIKPSQTHPKHPGQEGRFKMPKLGITMPKEKEPKTHLNVLEEDTDETLTNVKIQGKIPNAELEEPAGKLEQSRSKFKLPSFNLSKFRSAFSFETPEVNKEIKTEDSTFKTSEDKDTAEQKQSVMLDMGTEGERDSKSLPQVHGLAVHLRSSNQEENLPKRDTSFILAEAPESQLLDTDITLPRATAEFCLPSADTEPSADFKPTQTEPQTSTVKESPSKFKLPAFKFPKIGVITPNVSAKAESVEKHTDNVDRKVGAPCTITSDVKASEVQRSDVEIGLSKKKGIGTDLIADLSAETKAPETKGVKLKEGSPSKFKMPTVKLPKLGFDTPSSTWDKDAVTIVDTQGPTSDMKTAETGYEGKQSNFKVSAPDFSVPPINGYDMDLSLTKMDVNVTIPEAEGEVSLGYAELKKVSTEDTSKGITAATTDNERSELQFRFPAFKFSKFGVSSTTEKDSTMDKDGYVGGVVDGEASKTETEVKSVDLTITETEDKDKGNKFKLPSIGLSLPQAKGPDVDFSPSDKNEAGTITQTIKGIIDQGKHPEKDLEIKVVSKDSDGSPSRFKMPTFKLPMFKLKTQSSTEEEPAVDKDVPTDKEHTKTSEEVLTVTIAAPSIETDGLPVDIQTTETTNKGKGAKFKLPSLGFSVSEVKGPDSGLSSSKTGPDVKLPETKAEVKLSDVKLKQPSTMVKDPEIRVVSKDSDGSPSRFKMPTFKLPTFKLKTQSSTEEEPALDKDENQIPEGVLEVTTAAQSTETKDPSVNIKSSETEHEGDKSKFKLPSLGFSISGAKEQDINSGLSNTDKDVPLSETKAEVKLSDVKLKQPSTTVKDPEIKVVSKDSDGSPSRFKMPTFKLPTFKLKTQSSTEEEPALDKDVTTDKEHTKTSEEVLTVAMAAPSIETDGLPVDFQTTETKYEGKGAKFKLPSLGFSVSEVKGPDSGLSSSKTGPDLRQPETKVEVKLSEVKLKQPSTTVKDPEIRVVSKDSDGSPSRFKMPTFKLPTFKLKTQSSTEEEPAVDKDVPTDKEHTKTSEEVLTAIAAPSIETDGLPVDIQTTETKYEGKRAKFKLPSLGFSVSEVKCPDSGLSSSKTGPDVKLPETKVEVKLSDVCLRKTSVEQENKTPEIKVLATTAEGSPSKFKVPTFKLPKIGLSTPGSTGEELSLDNDAKTQEINISDKVPTVSTTAVCAETKDPSIDIKLARKEPEEKGHKIKMPSLGFSVSGAKEQDIKLDLKNIDKDVPLSETKAEVKLSDVKLKQPSTTVKDPEIRMVSNDSDGSPSRFKMPTFKLPKFKLKTQSSTEEEPALDKDVPTDKDNTKTSEEVLAVTMAAPSIETDGLPVDIQTTETEHKGKGAKIKLPSLGFSVSEVKSPDSGLSSSKTGPDVKLPETKAEVKLSDVKLKQPSTTVKAPEIKVVSKDSDGSPSRFKMPTFKLPTFKLKTQSSTEEEPALDKDVPTDKEHTKTSEEVLTVAIAAPSIETDGLPVDIQTTETEYEGKGAKFKLPSLGFSVSEVKGPDSGLSSSKTGPDVKLPETKAEVKLSDVKLKQPSTTVKAPEIKVVSKDSDGSPSRFKMPTFKLPTFKLKTQSSTEEEPALDKDVTTDKEHTKTSEEVLTVAIAAPSIETDGLPVDIQTTEIEYDGKGAKFKLPSLGFSVSEVKGPDSGLSSSKTGPDVKLPETKAEVKPSDVKLKQPSTTVKDPEIKVVAKDSDGSPSRFKMPTFKLPKFKLKTQSSTEEEPALDKDENQIPEGVLGLITAAQSTETKDSSVDIKTSETEHEGEKSKFKLPSLAFSVPQVKGPDVDLSSSKMVVKMTGPEPVVPDVEQKLALTGVETKPHDVKGWTKNTDGSPSKLKMPTIKIPKFGVGSPGPEKPVLDKDIKTAEAETEGLSADKTAASEHKGKESRFKLPTLGFSVPQTKETDFSLKVDVDVRPPETKAQIKLPDEKVKKPSAEVEITTPGTDLKFDNVEESKSKFKTPTFKLPRLGASPPQVNMEEPLFSEVKPPRCDTDLSNEEVEVKMPKSDIKMLKIKDMDTLKEHVDITHPAVKAEGQCSDGKQPLVTMNIRPPEIKPHISTNTSPKFGIVIPQLGEEVPSVKKNEKIKAEIRVKSVDTKDSQLKKGLDEMLQEATAEGKLCRVVLLEDVPTGEIKASLKQPYSGAGDVHIKYETNKADVCLPGAGVEGPPGATLSQAAELKKSKFSLPTISFSKSRIKEPEVKADSPNPDAFVPDVEVKVEHKLDLTVPELKMGADGKGSALKGVGLSSCQKAPDFKTTEVKEEMKFSKDEVKLNSASVETTASEAEAKSKDVRGSPLKFKMPTLKMPKFGSASQNVPTEGHTLEKVAKTEEGKLQKEAAIILKDPTVGSKAATPEMEPSMTETDDGKLKRTTFKIPQLSLSKPKAEKAVPADKENQPELKTDSKGEHKSPKRILTSFGKILKTIDVEFDVPKADSNAEISKTVSETDETTIRLLETKEKEAKSKQDSIGCPWKGDWSPPEEPPKIPEIAQQKNDTSPVGQMREEEISPTCSVQSSDAFADISSTVTSEPIGPNLQSPTMVTVRCPYPSSPPGPGETLCDTTRSERIPDESNITEKIINLPPRVSSTIEDTLRLESEQIHIITSKTERLTTVLEQPARGLPVEPDAEAASWDVGGSKIFTKTMFEMHTVTEMSGDSNQSKEALVITKQVTRLSEPISGETASSIQRLRDSVHSDKMRFFDEAEE